MKKMTKRAHHQDPELHEMVKLMEMEDKRDEMRKLEDERISYARRMREMTSMQPAQQGVTARGWMDKNR